MIRVVALVPDLLFGSQVVGMLSAAGHEVELCPTIADTAMHATDAQVAVVDLTGDLDPAEVAHGLERTGGGGRPAILGFYAHVHPEARVAAQAAGFELVVPRSRMAREGAALVESLTTS